MHVHIQECRLCFQMMNCSMMISSLSLEVLKRQTILIPQHLQQSHNRIHHHQYHLRAWEITKVINYIHYFLHLKAKSVKRASNDLMMSMEKISDERDAKMFCDIEEKQREMEREHELQMQEMMLNTTAPPLNNMFTFHVNIN